SASAGSVLDADVVVDCVGADVELVEVAAATLWVAVEGADALESVARLDSVAAPKLCTGVSDALAAPAGPAGVDVVAPRGGAGPPSSLLSWLSDMDRARARSASSASISTSAAIDTSVVKESDTSAAPVDG